MIQWFKLIGAKQLEFGNKEMRPGVNLNAGIRLSRDQLSGLSPGPGLDWTPDPSAPARARCRFWAELPLAAIHVLRQDG
jgi:hypothetical protein